MDDRFESARRCRNLCRIVVFPIPMFAVIILISILIQPIAVELRAESNPQSMTKTSSSVCQTVLGLGQTVSSELPKAKADDASVSDIPIETNGPKSHQFWRTHIIQEIQLNAQSVYDSMLKAAAHIKSSLFPIIRRNLFAVSAFSVVPLAAVTGGDVGLATAAAIKLGGGIFVVSEAIRAITFNAERVVPRQLFIPLVAGSTNLTELGASQAAALKGDLIGDVASTPMGSNSANVLYTGVALISSLHKRALEKGILKPGEAFSIPKIRETLREYSWTDIRKQMGIAGLFTLDALTFQYVVRPALNKGNLVPLGGWLAVNLPVVFEYFRRTAFSINARMASNIEVLNPEILNKVTVELLNSSAIPSDRKPEILGTMALIEKIRSELKFESSQMRELRDRMQALRQTLESSPEFAAEISRVLQKMDAVDLGNLFVLAKLNVKGPEKLTEVEKRKHIVKLVAGIAAFCAISPILDSGVTQLADALPYMSKSSAGFFVMSFVATLGEFLTTKGFFAAGADGSATKNIADSNAYNIIIAKMAMGTSYLSYLMMR